MSKNFNYALLIFGLVGCGAKRIEPSFGTLTAVEIVPSAEPRPKLLPEVSACEYWRSLSQHEVATGNEFQLISDLKIYLTRFGNDFAMEGRFYPRYLPQLPFLLSGEYLAIHEDLDFIENAKTLPTQFDATLDQLMGKAEELYAAENLNSTTYYGLKLSYGTWNSGGRSSALEKYLRKEVGSRALSSTLPGIFGEKASDLLGSKIGVDLKKLLKGAKLSIAHKDALVLLGNKVPVFVSDDWNLRREDLRLSLAALHGKASSDSEVICRYAVGHRILAQVVKIKGIKSAPKLESSGYFSAMTDAAYPQEDIPGEFNESVATLPWVMKYAAEKKPEIRIKNVKTLSQTLSALGYFVELTWHRNEEAWKNYLLPEVLPLGFGLYGILGKSITGTKSQLDSDNRFSFTAPEDDSPDNLAKLLLLAIDMVESLEPMEKPSEMEKTLVTLQQREELTKDLRMRLLGLMVETRARFIEGRGSPSLKAAHDEVADRVGNPWLKTFTKKY